MPRGIPEDTALRGTVRGQGGNVYQAAAFFSLADGLPAEFEMGECSCPVEFNCKHVVALVLSALAPGQPGRPGRRARQRRPGSSHWTRCWTPGREPRAAARRRWRSSSR